MVNLSNIRQDVFYKHIYPLLAREFLLGSDYQTFADLVSRFFILSREQWEEVFEEWEDKENLLKL